MRRYSAGMALAAMLGMAGFLASAGEGPVKVELRGKPGEWSLYRGGQPYFIKGGGGDGDKKLLQSIGGNSGRTWGVGSDTQGKLDEAQSLGQTVTVGFWLGHVHHGFDYENAEQLAKQKEEVRRGIEKYKNHPAVLAWSLGNEMEIGLKNTEVLWKHVNDLAKMAKKLDPNHPTMTVVADFNDEKIQSIHRLCPDIDIIGINSYGGGPSVAKRYRNAGGTKPYVMTEYGPNGTWEWKKTHWNAPLEPSSTEKGEVFYRNVYAQAIEAEKGKLCLGGYAFTWGYKVEGTPTWFGMLLPTAKGDIRLAACDVMEEYWTGKKPANPCPRITGFTVDANVEQDLKPGQQFTATVAAELAKPENAYTFEYELFKDSKEYTPYQGHGLPMPPSFPEAVEKNNGKTAVIKMPDEPGPYYLYVRILDDTRGAATAMIPLNVEGELKVGTPKVNAPRPWAFPLVVVGDEVRNPAPWIASGYMGNTGAISMDAGCPDNPKNGDTCLKVEYRAKDNWGGVFWQSPANDWGDQAGGFNLTGAEKLVFWARGAKGGEKVKILFGTSGREKPYYDTGSGELEVVMTPDWKEYALDISKKDLRRIKHGLGWVIAGQGEAVTFYLDDVRYVGTLPPPGSKDPEPAAEADPAPAASGELLPGVKRGRLPFAVLTEEADGRPTYIPSGYMGNTGAISMNEVADSPKLGAKCLKVEYKANDNWAGVYWQSPANDWGERPGGFDLTGAKSLKFWARGAKGGEKVKMLFGTSGRDKPYFDTDSGEMEIVLTPNWTEYAFDLAGKDLRRIKSGFGWVVGGQGAPVTFYLDGARYE